MNRQIKRKSIFYIENFETLKVVSDPLRIRLLDEINLANDQGEFRTVKEIATALEMAPHKLYYHMRLLEEHGLIQVAETHIVSGIIEKHYALTALRIHIAENLFNSGDRSPERSDSAAALFDSALSSTRSDFINYMDSTEQERSHLATHAGRSAHFTQERVSLSPDQAAEFLARLYALTEEFSGAKGSPSSDNHTVYNLMTVLVPAATKSNDDSRPASKAENNEIE